MRIKIIVISLFVITALALAACGSNHGKTDYIGTADTTAENHNHDTTQLNLVDKRYELVSLVFRLAGTQSHSSVHTDYQRSLQTTFEAFRDHPLVIYTMISLRFGYDAVLQMAVHLETTDKGFVLTDDIDALIAPVGNSVRWTRTSATRFVELLNDFYEASGFAEFFDQNMGYFKEHTARFVEQVYNDVNHEWFIQHGLNPNNMRPIISPACSLGGYAVWIFGDTPEDTIAYMALSGTEDYSRSHGIIVHEYVHAFANPIAEAWYAENETFRAWSDASVDLTRMPFYPTGLFMAFEYVTRAYTILYMVENTGANPEFLFLTEKANGFPYIAQVYAMITGDIPID